MADFEVKIATDAREIEQAQRLRFNVFNLELHKGLASSYEHGLDIDEFDPYCDHLIVRELRSGDIVGTYRLLRGAQSRRHIGFYSEKEFDLTRIKTLDGELMELGRSCARKDFRDRALIPLMWEAIVEQIRAHHVRYLFGCGSLYTTDIAEVSAVRPAPASPEGGEQALQLLGQRGAVGAAAWGLGVVVGPCRVGVPYAARCGGRRG